MFKKEQIKTRLGKVGMEIPPDKIEKLALFSNHLLSTNRKINLLARGEEENFLERHLIDSLVALPLLEKEKPPLMDIGSGGGLPGIPLAICCPKRPFFLVETREKKAGFLQEAVRELGLEEVHVIQERVEDLGKNQEFREKMGVVTARGLAPLPSLIELSLPFLRVGGILLAWKGRGLEEEIKNSEKALELLGGVPGKRVSSNLLGKPHFLQVIIKEKTSPERFPRRPAAIKKRPLG